MIFKVVRSAVANAAQAVGAEPEELFVSRAFVDEGPTMKRWRPRAMGRAYPRLRRSCHLSVVLRRRSPEELVAEADVESAAPELANTES